MRIFLVDEAVARSYLLKKVSLVISKNSRENTVAGVFLQA